MRGAKIPVPAPLAVLRFPRTLPQVKGRTGATTPAGELVLLLEGSQRGKQVDVSGPAGEPLGRMVFTGRHRWVLVAPYTAAVLAEATTRAGVQVSVGGGPWATVRGYGEQWEMTWERSALLVARTTPRKIAKRCVDVEVYEPRCTPRVVAFVLHVWRVWQAAETSNQIMLQQTLTASSPPPASS